MVFGARLLLSKYEFNPVSVYRTAIAHRFNPPALNCNSPFKGNLYLQVMESAGDNGNNIAFITRAERISRSEMVKEFILEPIKFGFLFQIL